MAGRSASVTALVSWKTGTTALPVIPAAKWLSPEVKIAPTAPAATALRRAARRAAATGRVVVVPFEPGELAGDTAVSAALNGAQPSRFVGLGQVDHGCGLG